MSTTTILIILTVFNAKNVYATDESFSKEIDQCQDSTPYSICTLEKECLQAQEQVILLGEHKYKSCNTDSIDSDKFVCCPVEPCQHDGSDGVCVPEKDCPQASAEIVLLGYKYPLCKIDSPSYICCPKIFAQPESKSIKLSVAVCEKYRRSYGDHMFHEFMKNKRMEMSTLISTVKNCISYMKHFLSVLEFNSAEQISIFFDQEEQTTTEESFEQFGSVEVPLEPQEISRGTNSYSQVAQINLRRCTQFLRGLQYVPIPEYPHMTALIYNSSDTYKCMCGGALISSKFVITAAHCMDYDLPVFVRMGTTLVPLSIEGLNNNFDYRVKKTFVHPLFDSTTKTNDVGLIELEKDVHFSTYVNPACLYTEEDDPKELVITGWGSMNLNEQRSEHLMKAEVHFVPQENCLSAYSDKLNITDSFICATGKEGDSCMGDSGSPIQVADNGIFKVVGVTSAGQGCGSATPGLYTKVYPYLDWIESIVWSNSTN